MAVNQQEKKYLYLNQIIQEIKSIYSQEQIDYEKKEIDKILKNKQNFLFDLYIQGHMISFLNQNIKKDQECLKQFKKISSIEDLKWGKLNLEDYQPIQVLNESLNKIIQEHLKNVA
ncbi:hypothetical protein PPERSA_01399 [Pseudocohnilembus persalinus]|uniref:Uncharacterized protein n=1 Tax=Pseudocohnilembus persalinus TaxID=266149 RepID=A0A0V0QH60_PSEPJ|nr:hypothetical protein PPERSA_01399 [Pseudocohnilembus persalinus]|eukprot:KRX01496.1 hypothetical protein PPERSA_01399 [Pseudocohnilembus persalinus]